MRFFCRAALGCALLLHPPNNYNVRAWNINPFLTRRFDSSLLNTAERVRTKIPSPPAPNDDSLAFPSVYKNGNGVRGFCNWLIPGRLMIGQYPGCTPESNGPSSDEVEKHIRLIVQGAGINFFCCLQSEVPAQTDFKVWEKQGGQVFLNDYLRDDFPRPFTHYAPLVQSAASSIVDDGSDEIEFLHYPIEDLSVPDSKPIQLLLTQLLEAMDNGKVIYLHCWGGRGRAGLVGACLVSLLFPELDAKAVLDLVQSGYDSRAGASKMPLPLSRSPQTKQQRDFVRKFVEECQRQ